ncbi:PDR/VanB family oxidoreductase [Streptomyces sp. NPDC003023]|uniref:PDR/VanB family oxidoreductase n=1 Tax=Streptomyces sp. NPDC003023 TaxID=3364675 RepID=UPI0036B4B0B2
MTRGPRQDGASFRELVVRGTVREADGVLGVFLTDPAGAVLPPWRPGAHVEVRLPSGRVRHYSLCGDPSDPAVYRLGVLRQPFGRGGSEELHSTPLEGRTLLVRGPFNRFPLVAADHYVFVAGGIGITPLLPMVRAVAAEGVPWSLHYGGRSLASMAYRDELAELPGGEVTLVPQDTRGMLDLDRALGGIPEGTAVYCCGPGPLLAAVEQRCARLGAALHTERFTAPDAGGAPEDAAAPEGATVLPSGPSGPSGPLGNTGAGHFEVELRRTGRTLQVPAGRSLLDVVREAVPGVAFSCEEGWCGTCETKVVGGLPEHRDSVLTDAERAFNSTMMICVGRSRSRRLTLDL